VTVTTEPKLILLVGNIGSGKTLLSKRFVVNGAVRVCHDDLLSMMHGGAYVPEMREVYHQMEEDVIGGTLTRGGDVIVDRTNLDEATRARFLQIAKFISDKRRYHDSKAPEVKVVCYDFGPGNDSDLYRRIRQPRGVLASTWANVFQTLRAKYEKPRMLEGIDEIVEVDNKLFRFFAFDVDGTIVENSFPDVGGPIDSTIQIMRRLWEDPHHFIILHTCREDRFIRPNGSSITEGDLNRVVAFVRENGIPCDFVNCNPWVDFGGRKLFAHVYVDDRGVSLENLEASLSMEPQDAQW